MNAERYQRVFEIFMGICYLPVEEHGPALERACGGDAELRREVEAFLGYYEVSAGEAGATASPSEASRVRLAAGVVVGGAYRVDELIGEGGIGAVYLATDLVRGGAVALKVVAGHGAEMAASLERESRAVARLAHRNIIAIHDFGHEPGVGPYLVMELLGGRTLDAELAARGRFDLARALSVVDRIGAAAEAAHAAGVIHRDLKPQNVMLEPAEGGPVVKVLDFGLAKLLDPNTIERDLRSISGALAGTPHFMSPEQCEGRPLDARSDVYSLGCILYALVTGRPPFEGDSIAAVLLKHLDDVPRPPSAYEPSLPAGLDAAVLRALAKDPAERQQSAAELRAELARLSS